MNQLHRLAVMSAAVAAGLLFCTNLDLAGGSSSTDNGKVLGTISHENGLPASHTQVTLRPSNFDPYQDFHAARIDTTDSAGDYAFLRVAPGSYTVEAVELRSRERALVSSVIVDSTVAYAPIVTLAKPAALSVVTSGSDAVGSCYVYIPGTSCYGVVRGGVAFIDSIPAGTIPSIHYNDLNNPVSARVVKSAFIVRPGSLQTIADYSEWKHSRKLVLNTTAQGAGVAGDVCNFPVLVRLSAAVFDFSQARSDGSDLRFKKSDDSPLVYEIERWDANARSAEIWVRVDTVRGNDSTQFIAMFWGNPVAPALSNPGAVFDTAIGFQGVWHLSGEALSTAYDATINDYYGIPTATAAVQGAIGGARGFNGTSSYIIMPNTAASALNFPEDGTYSMSLWVYADTLDTLWRAIAGKGHEQYYMQLKGLGHNRATWEFVEFQDRRGWEYTEDSVPPAPGAKQWIYLTGVRAGNSQQLYINGKLAVDTAKLMPGVYDRNTGDNFLIGRFGRSVTIPYYQGWSYFKGRVDEVRVARGTLTADWIRLCYMNQRADDRLVQFR